MKKIGILLLSDQTIPNLQFIKAMDRQLDGYLFITTKEMEKKGIKQHLLCAAGLDESRVLSNTLSSPHDFSSILSEIDASLSPDVEYHLNVTGGTKMMAIAAYDVLKSKESHIYYITYDRELMKIFPETSRIPLNFTVKLHEYLQAYGHELKFDEKPPIPSALVGDFFDFFLENGMPDCLSVFFKVRKKKRKKSKKIELTPEMSACLSKITDFFDDKSEISSSELRAITGEWLEQWVYSKVKEELHLQDDQITKGLIVKRSVPNELDVVFVYKDQLYVIECKSSLFTVFTDKNKESEKTRGQNLITPTIYKSDSLQSEFGLYPRTFILTMDNLEAFSDTAKQRARNKRIKLIGRENLKEVRAGKPLSSFF